MTTMELDEQYSDLFAELYEEFTDELIPCELMHEGEGRFNSLTVFFEDLAAEGNATVGEFYFLPLLMNDDSDLQIFVNYFTLETEVAEENLGEVIGAANILNAYLPVGSFFYDPESKGLCYRYAAALPFPLSDEALKDQVDLAMGVAVDILQRFGYMILEVNDGERNAESLLGVLTPENMQEQDTKEGEQA